MRIDRNFSLTEQQDFELNIKPLLGNHTGRAEGIYIMRNPAPFLTGWLVINMSNGAHISDSHSGQINPSLQVITNFPPIQQSLPNKYNGHTS